MILSRYDGCPLKRHCGAYALTDICNDTAPDTEKKMNDYTPNSLLGYNSTITMSWHAYLPMLIDTTD